MNFKTIWDRSLDEINNKKLNVTGSPPFQVTIADLAASASMFYGLENDSTIGPWRPMNYLRIMNTGGTTLKVYLNDSTIGEIILNSTIYEHKGDVWNFKLENTDGSNTALGALIFAHVQRKPMGV